MQKFFLGVDVGKKTLDLCLINDKDNVQSNYQVKNQPSKIAGLFEQIQDKYSRIIVGIENTGVYGNLLLEQLRETKFSVYLVSPLRIKKSSGLKRGKTDQIDARRIADFIRKNYRELTPWKPPRPVIKKLKQLLTYRKQLIKTRTNLKVSGQQQQQFNATDVVPLMEESSTEIIDTVNEKIGKVEQRIRKLIKEDKWLKKLFRWVSSVQGVGKVLAWHCIAATNEFKKYTHPKQFACYSGVAPFPHRSGTSIRGRTRVSHFADKKLKQLLHLAAMSAIRLKGDLRDYYQRKVKEGKHRMSVINAVRNKIIWRVYAVVREEREYVNFAA